MGKKSTFVGLALVCAAIAAFFAATSFATAKYTLGAPVIDNSWVEPANWSVGSNYPGHDANDVATFANSSSRDVTFRVLGADAANFNTLTLSVDCAYILELEPGGSNNYFGFASLDVKDNTMFTIGTSGDISEVKLPPNVTQNGGNVIIRGKGFTPAGGGTTWTINKGALYENTPGYLCC